MNLKKSFKKKFMKKNKIIDIDLEVFGEIHLIYEINYFLH